MSIAFIIGIVIFILLVVGLIVSRIADIVIGILTAISGTIVYLWLSSTSSWMSQLQMLFKYGISPSDLRTYSVAAIIFGVVILVIGIIRGKKTQKIVYINQQPPYPQQYGQPMYQQNMQQPMNQPMYQQNMQQPMNQPMYQQNMQQPMNQPMYQQNMQQQINQTMPYENIQAINQSEKPKNNSDEV